MPDDENRSGTKRENTVTISQFNDKIEEIASKIRERGITQARQAAYESIASTLPQREDVTPKMIEFYDQVTTSPVPMKYYRAAQKVLLCLKTGRMYGKTPIRMKRSADIHTPRQTPLKKEEDKPETAKPEKEPYQHINHLIKQGTDITSVPFFALEAITDALVNGDLMYRQFHISGLSKKGRDAAIREMTATDIRPGYGSLDEIEMISAQRGYFKKGLLTRLVQEQQDCPVKIYAGLVELLAEYETRERVYIPENQLDTIVRPAEYDICNSYVFGQMVMFAKKQPGVVLRMIERRNMIVAMKVLRESEEDPETDKKTDDKTDKNRKSYELQRYKVGMHTGFARSDTEIGTGGLW